MGWGYVSSRRTGDGQGVGMWRRGREDVEEGAWESLEEVWDVGKGMWNVVWESVEDIGGAMGICGGGVWDVEEGE